MEASPFGVWASQSALAYPIANTLHVIGAILLVGSIGLLDLRVLGYARAAPLIVLSRALTPLGLAGFGVMLLSGSVLFAADARALVASPVFGTKVVLILLGGLNALAFHRAWRGETPSARAKALAALSLALWLSVVVAGRWIAYA